MQPQYDHKIINSFYLWAEDRLARVGEASVTGITQNFVYSDLGTPVPPNMYAYYSNDRQFLTIGDSEVVGQAVPSGVYIDGVFSPQIYCSTSVQYPAADWEQIYPPGGIYEGIWANASPCPNCWEIGDTVIITWPAAADFPPAPPLVAEIYDMSIGSTDCDIGYRWAGEISDPPEGYDITVSNSTATNVRTGVIIDNYNGRVLVTSNVGKTATISGNFPRKEINTYITQHDEEELLLNQEFVVNGISFLEATSQMGWDRYTIPAVFITQARSDNTPFAMGGTDQTINNLTMVVITDNSYLLNGTMSLFKDTKNLQFALLGAFDTPYGGFFDIKSIPYTYTGYTDGQTDYVHIDDVKTSVFKGGGKITESLKGKYVGFVDFTISNIRNPRIC